MNHLHIADIQYFGCEDASKDKLLLLGNVLKEIYQAKLLWQLADRPCSVELYIPDDEEDLLEYQLSFWQTCHE
jgi:methyl coenzyme M reductase subunit C